MTHLTTRILAAIALGTACSEVPEEPNGPRGALAEPATTAEGHVVHFTWRGGPDSLPRVELEWHKKRKTELTPLEVAWTPGSPMRGRLQMPSVGTEDGVLVLTSGGVVERLPVQLLPDPGDFPCREELGPGRGVRWAAWYRACFPMADDGCPDPEDAWTAIAAIDYARAQTTPPDWALIPDSYDIGYPDECCLVVNIDPDPDGPEDTGGAQGRPFRVDGRSRHASLTAPRTAIPAVEHWTAAALAEHASVASFARLQLELMALGAGPELLQRTAQAQLDEIAHTRFALSMVERLGGATLRLGPLDMTGATERLGDPEAILEGAIREGCFAETVAAAQLRCAAELARDDLREELLTVAEDETRHAELSWAIVAWLVSSRPELRPLARRVFDEELAAALPNHAHPDGLIDVGILDSARALAVHAQVRDTTIRPAVRTLLG